MKLKLIIEGMHCNGCKKALENELKEDKNIKSVSVNLEEGSATLEVEEKVKFKTLEKLVKKAGFKCTNIEEI